MAGISGTEQSHVTLQLFEDDETVFLDFEVREGTEQRGLSEEQRELIRNIPILRGIPEDVLTFRDFTPDDGKPFTEINATAVRQAIDAKRQALEAQVLAGEMEDADTMYKIVAEANRLFLTEQRLALEIWGTLSRHPHHLIELDDTKRPIEQRDTTFVGPQSQ